jgi:hypothetical protein
LGNRFDSVAPASDGAVGNDGPRHDATPSDAGDVGNDRSYDAIPTDMRGDGSDAGAVRDGDAAGNDASQDPNVADGTPTDSSPRDSADGRASLDGTLVPDRTARDALLDGVPSDAPSPDAAGMPWCAGKQIAFCADFDAVTSWGDGWTTVNVTPGAVLDFNLVDFTSPQRSLHSQLPSSAGGMGSARLTKLTSTTLPRSVLEFDCNVASIGAGSGQWLLQIARLGRNGPDNGVALLAQDMRRWAIFLTTDVPVFLEELPAPPPYGRFVHMSIDVVWSVTAGSVNVLFDGVTVFTRNAVSTALGATTSSVEVAVGLVAAAGTTPAADISIDNVALQLR